MAMNETFRRRYIRRNAEIACNMALREAMAKRDARKAASLLKIRRSSLKRCSQVYDSKVFICPKACSGYILGKFGNDQTI